MRLALAAATVSIGLAAIFFFATTYSDVGSYRSVVIESPRPSSPSPARTEPAPARTETAAARAEPTPAPAPVAAAPSGVELPPVTAVRANTRLAIGRISSNVSKHWPRLEAMANYLAAELAPYGVTGVDIKMVDTMEEMQELLVAGEVDLLSETAFAAIELTRSGSADMLLREWKSGVSDYHTVIFARRDSGIDSLDDLVGRTIAFEDRGSTSPVDRTIHAAPAQKRRVGGVDNRVDLKRRDVTFHNLYPHHDPLSPSVRCARTKSGSGHAARSMPLIGPFRPSR